MMKQEPRMNTNTHELEIGGSGFIGEKAPCWSLRFIVFLQSSSTINRELQRSAQYIFGMAFKCLHLTADTSKPQPLKTFVSIRVHSWFRNNFCSQAIQS